MARSTQYVESRLLHHHNLAQQDKGQGTDGIFPPPAVDFFNHLNMLYGTITEFCTPQEVYSTSPLNQSLFETHRFIFVQCPIMSAGPR